jgi:hypothetical protein
VQSCYVVFGFSLWPLLLAGVAVIALVAWRARRWLTWAVLGVLGVMVFTMVAVQIAVAMLNPIRC